MQAMLEDVVFGAKAQIAGDLTLAATPHATVEGLGLSCWTCRQDVMLKPGEPTFPEPPIAGKAKA